MCPLYIYVCIYILFKLALPLLGTKPTEIKV